MKVPESYFDEVFDFAGQWDMPSKCGLKIVDTEQGKTIIVTELYQDNPGTSVTYAGGSLLDQICRSKGLDIEKVKYLECNPDTKSKLSFYDEEYFEVTFSSEKAGVPFGPSYRKLSADEVEKLLGKKK